MHYNDPICPDCADKKKFVSKDKAVGMWIEACSVCKEQRYVVAVRDYHIPGQRPATLEDVLLHQALHPDE